MFFASIENIANRIIRFVHYMDQIIVRLSKFEVAAYFPQPRTYGRAMSKAEYENTLNTGHLSCGKDPTPVFDAPPAVVERLSRMSRDQLKNFFAVIGVVGAVHLVLFRTRRKPINYGRPIPQSNGLREYKFPRGMRIQIVARV